MANNEVQRPKKRDNHNSHLMRERREFFQEIYVFLSLPENRTVDWPYDITDSIIHRFSKAIRWHKIMLAKEEAAKEEAAKEKAAGPYIILVFAYRKLGLSPADFKTHYEKIHVPLLQSLAGDTFPNSHVRRYVQRFEYQFPYASGTRGGNNVNTPATVLMGLQADFEYDAFAELTFDDEAAFQTFSAKVGQGEAAKKIAEDEEKFLDRGKTKIVVVGESIVTTKS